MKPKKILSWILKEGTGFQERLFRLLALIGLAAIGIGVVAGTLIGESTENVLLVFAAFGVLSVIVAVTLRTKKIQIGAVVTGALVVFLVLPYNFFTSGGFQGGAAVWFLFGLIYVALVIEGKLKIVFLIGGFAMDLACYYVARYYPQYIIVHTDETAYMDSVVTFAIVGALTCCMISFQQKLYTMENDVTKEQKKEIERLNAAQSGFFSNMSHEIRTPINTIIGLNELILREDVSNEVAADAKGIQGASKMLLTLINDILDMSKMEAGKMEIVPDVYDVGAMLSDIVNMIWVRAKEKGLEFHIDVDSAIPARLYGDEVRIKQVLINVLNNAVKYTERGSITLDIQCRREEGNHVTVMYTVTDTGKGIRKESIPHLFDAFSRVDEGTNHYIEGTGLGLSIVKQLVDLMHGEITVNSVFTQGSTFIVTIPQAAGDAEKLGKIDIEKRHMLGERGHYRQSFEAPGARILIVDDNEANLMVETKLLRATKVGIDTAKSGEACLGETLQRHYDVIFMDHLMPGMDGIETLRAIRAQTGGFCHETPVVILTANAGSENQELYRREGFDGYLLKPVSGVELEAELLKFLPKDLVERKNGDLAESEDEETLKLAHKLKRPILISTDSVCDLPEYLLEKHRIAMLPYHVVTEGGEFLDGVETGAEGVLSYLAEREGKVRSEAPSVADYERFFAKQLVKAQYIIHVAMAKNASRGCANALEAAETFDNVIVVDSGHLSSGMGLMVLQAAKLAEAGNTKEQIVEAMERLRTRVRTSFIVDDTKYLARSGRVSAGVHRLCSALMLHPVIVLRNSGMKVGAIRIGTRDRVWKRYIESALDVLGIIDTETLFITYAGLTDEQLGEIETQVAKKVTFGRVIRQKASSAISANCGPGTFGLLFAMK